MAIDISQLISRAKEKVGKVAQRFDRDQSMSGFQLARGGLTNRVNQFMQTPVSVPRPIYQAGSNTLSTLKRLPSSQYVMGRGQESADRIIGGIQGLQRPGIANKALGGLSLLSGGLSLTPAGQAREALVGAPLAGIKTGSQLLSGQQVTPGENIRRGVTGIESLGTSVNPLTRKLLGEQGGDMASQALDIGNMALGMYKGGKYDPETQYLKTIRSLPDNFTPKPGSILKPLDLTRPELKQNLKFEPTKGGLYDLKRELGGQDKKVIAKIFTYTAQNKKANPGDVEDIRALGKKYLKGVNVDRMRPEAIITDLYKHAYAPQMDRFLSDVKTPKLSVEPTKTEVKTGLDLYDRKVNQLIENYAFGEEQARKLNDIPRDFQENPKEANRLAKEAEGIEIGNRSVVKQIAEKLGISDYEALDALSTYIDAGKRRGGRTVADFYKWLPERLTQPESAKPLSVEPSSVEGGGKPLVTQDQISPMGRLKTAEIDKTFAKIPDGTVSPDGYVIKRGDKLYPTEKATPEILKNSRIELNPDGSYKENNFGVHRMSFTEDVALESLSPSPQLGGKFIKGGLNENIDQSKTAAIFRNVGGKDEFQGHYVGTDEQIKNYTKSLGTDYQYSKLAPSQLGGKVGGEVSSPTGIRTGQEMVSDLPGTTELGMQSVGGKSIRTKPNSEVSLPPIISNKGKLNLERLAVDDTGKQALQDINRGIPTSVIGNKSVIERAKTAKGKNRPMSDEQMQDLMAQQLKNRQQVVDLSAKFSKAKSEGASEQELGKIMLELSNQSRTAQQGGTFAGRLLQAQNIVADQSATPMQKILALLDNAGVDQKKYLKDSIKVDWENPTEVVKFYRKYVPPNLGEVITEIRYTNMLSSPLTHITNIASNALQTGLVTPVEKTITGLLDAVRSQITGKERQYYASAGINYAKGYLKSLPEALQKAKNIMNQTETTIRPDMEYMPTGVGGPLQAYTTPLRALEAMDQFFRTLIQGGVTRELRNGPKKLSQTQVANQAVKEADYRVFRQAFDPNGELGQGPVLQMFDKWNSAINGLRRLPGGKWVLPFLQTPTNILKQGVEYSPLGVITAPGSKAPLEQLSKAIIGTTVFTTAYQLASSGLTSWEAPSGEKERALYYAAGMQPYSVKIGDKWVSFSKLGPLAYPIAMAAALAEAERKNPDKSKVENVSKSVSGMLGFFGDQSYVRSIGDLVDAIQGGVNVGPSAISGQAANMAGQLIPYKSFQTWLGRMVDPTYRKAQTFTEKMIKDIPILGSQLESYKDLQGNDSKRDLPFLNAISPLRVSQEKPGAVPMYERYQENKTSKKRIDDAKKAIESGQEVSSIDGVYLNMDGGTVDVGKVVSMPSTSGYDKVKKQEATYKIVDDVLKLPVDQQKEALSKLGVTPYQAQYYTVAKSSVEAKTAFVQDQLDGMMKQGATRNDVIGQIIKYREDVNGEQVASDNVLKKLVDQNIISKNDYNNLKQVKLVDGQIKRKIGGRSKKAKKIKLPKVKLIKTRVAKPKKVKIRRIKI